VAKPSLSWEFSKVPLFPLERADRPEPSPLLVATPLPGAVQAKLVVGKVNDPLEHEADRIADQVMRMPDPRAEASPAPIQVSRACALCETDELRSEKSASWSKVSDALTEPGQPLGAATRDFFEPRYQHDFSDVRVHTDARAAASASAVNALAYTVGRHIVFGAGQYAPSTPAGLILTAHELTHVVQQAGGAHALQRQPAPPGPTPAIDAGLVGLANFQRMIKLMCNDTTLRTAFEMIERDGVHIVLFQTAFDNWQYDDGHTEEEEFTGLWGNTDVAGRTIRLRNSLSPDTMTEVLFHELQHWKHYQDPAGPRGPESEIQALIATEQSAIDRGRPPTGPNYRTADGRVNEAEIRRRVMAASPTGRKWLGRRYVGEAPVAGPFVCPQIGDFPTPSGESRVT
jgi:hypothetical protein